MQEEIYKRFGYDFSQYNRDLPAHEGELNLEFVETLWNHTSYFFRNPDVFRALITHVFPCLHALPTVKIWHAGCAQGEEAYSLAILLKEAGLLAKTQIFATDISAKSLEKAKKGVYTYFFPSANGLERLEADYRKAGGKGKFADYARVVDFQFSMQDFGANIQFVEQDLLQGKFWEEIDLVLCRNVLIYFKPLAYKNILQTLYESLAPDGFLCLGGVETTLYHNLACWKAADKANNIWQARKELG